MKIDNIELSGTVSEVCPEDKVDLVKKAKGGYSLITFTS